MPARALRAPPPPQAHKGSKTHESAGDVLVAEGDALLAEVVSGRRARRQLPATPEFPHGRTVWQTKLLDVKGPLPGVAEGMELQLHGEWERHATHGLQVK